MARARRPLREGVSDAYARRNARARELGYKSYYDYRAHDHGRRPPGEPRATGETLARLRGHRSAADLAAAIKPDSLVVAVPGPRGPDGRYLYVTVTLVDADGREREYVLRGKQASRVSLERIASVASSAGAIVSPSKSLNISDLAAELDPGDLYDDEGYLE